MTENLTDIVKSVENVASSIDFSGVVLVTNDSNAMYQSAFGFANRSDKVRNDVFTKFGIASGCKLFTAIGIGLLVERGNLSFDTKLSECLNHEFKHFDNNITIHQLLTHSSGIPDYFDEEVMDNFEELWNEKSMYLLKNLSDFLPMFENNQMKFKPGERFHYNNAGYILLGLIIEQQTGTTFQSFVEKEIFKKCSMKDSGYYALDKLPINTAVGYIDNEETREWRTNIYSIPVIGGADGGAFITAPDMVNFWNSLLNYKIVSEEITKILLTPHIHVEEEDFYGYGMWISKKNQQILKYHIMGYDPGVSFHSAYYPSNKTITVITSNETTGAHDISKTIEEII